MTAIPRSALLLGLAGVVPFLWAAASHLWPGLGNRLWTLPPIYLGSYLAVTYGSVILSFMSGVLWGFSTRATGREAAVGYALSVIPALWCFFMVTDVSTTSILYLATGFLAVLGLDASFARQGLTPPWWMRLRLLLTGLVLVCLCVLIVA